jgi:hypothetical protein
MAVRVAEAEAAMTEPPLAQMLQLKVNGSRVTFAARRVIIAGFTGRNRAAVEQHIHELELHGVAAPPSVPAFYPVAPTFVSTADSFVLETANASGEAEAVLLFQDASLENALVATGSDITDRVLERESIARAKQLPKPISSAVWRWRDVRAQWDETEIVSYVTPEKDRCYQRGAIASLLPPEEVVARLPEEARADLAGTVLFLGTIPLCDPNFAFADYFACELRAPGGAALRCEYQVTRRT